MIGPGDNRSMRHFLWFLILVPLSTFAEEKMGNCGNAHLKAIQSFQQPLEASFQEKGELAQAFRATKSACARFLFEKSKSNLVKTEAALEDWNQSAAQLCEPYFDAEAQSHLFSKEMEKKCNGAVFREVIINLRSNVNGLKPICELVLNTQEMDVESACEEFGAKKTERIRF